MSLEVPIPPKLLGASKCILWNVESFAIVALRFLIKYNHIKDLDSTNPRNRGEKTSKYPTELS